MDFRTLELTVISANNLPKANHLTKMNPSVVAFLDGPSSFACVEERTPVDQEGDRNPTWNHTMMFTVDESEARKDRLILVFKIYSTGSFRRDKNKLLGEVRVPIKDILSDDNDHGDDGRDVVFRQARMISYPVIGENSGDSGGVLNLSYRFGVRKFSARLISNARRPFRQPGMRRP